MTRRRIAWTAGFFQGLLSGSVSTLVITLGAPRIGRARSLDWMEIGTVLLRADSVQEDPQWWNIAAGVFVHQAADLSWALVFFALLIASRDGRWFRLRNAWTTLGFCARCRHIMPSA
jgi:hypothetical protein